MHYIGMAALMLDGSIIWDRRIVGLSVVIAVVASGTALWLAFRLRDKGVFIDRILAALVMGAAICAMHYTGMSAAHFRKWRIPSRRDRRAGVIHLGFCHHALPAWRDVNYFTYRFSPAHQPADG
jgi:NO-binding membrane sensor protein with MHYT domain